ncbi:MAG: archaeosortase/exosortase family protein, partial [Gammaproteobacteria bacterium]|nr:archaeosortase/exosortase family protein [Gammaproteobacteria bacterium]
MSDVRSGPATLAGQAAQPSGNLLLVLGLMLVAAVALGVLFRDGLINMEAAWQSPEYNHGYIIPLVALYLLWLRSKDIQAAPLSGSWLGIGILAISLGVLALGELSAVFAITQYAFVLV